jgi:hypothetical protein
MTARHPVQQSTWLRRVGWLVLIWAAGVAALGVAATLFRVLMGVAGLTA